MNLDSVNWRNIVEIVYALAVLATVLRIITDTRNSAKTLAYVLAVLFLPFVGMLIYYSVGLNYRKRKLYDKKLIVNREMSEVVSRRIADYEKRVFDSGLLPEGYENTVRYNAQTAPISITAGNRVEVYVNGEEKFPALIKAIEGARHHIHLEYYIYADDAIGNRLADLLVRKAKQGVEVRFVYDDFGSHGIGKLVRKLERGGVKTAAFYKIRVYALANSLNYRNHRKIVVIDGRRAFVGGINVSDGYVNHNEAAKGNALYWRDTHLGFEGPAASALQYLFFADWNFCSGETIPVEPAYFPMDTPPERITGEVVQVVASGPDSESPTILYSILSAINAAKDNLWITSPYFIPTDSLLDALTIAARSGVEVKLLTPGKTDSRVVQAASRSYYAELLRAGVQVYEYQKGFVHAKTMVVDEALAIVGTANMDMRSFDLNFEVNAVTYGRETIVRLRRSFVEDLTEAQRIDGEKWLARPRHIRLFQKFMRLVSPLL